MSLVADVVAALHSARTTADDTRLTVSQVAGYAEAAAGQYTEAAQGTSHPTAQAAIQQMQAAQHRTNLIIAQVSRGVAAIDEYIRDIAPALASGGGQPSIRVAGDQLALPSPKSRGEVFFQTATKGAGDLANAGKSITKLAQRGLALDARANPPGPTHAGTHAPTAPTTRSPSPADAVPDMAAGVALALIVLGTGIRRSAQVLTRAILGRKHKANE